MENANISELRLLLEVTKIEDLAETSLGRADPIARKRLKEVAGGFRKLIADPKSYDAEDNEYLQRWATALRAALKGAEKPGHDPDAPEVERDLAVDLQNVDVKELYAGIRENIISQLNDTQKKAFPDALTN